MSNVTPFLPRALRHEERPVSPAMAQQSLACTIALLIAAVGQREASRLLIASGHHVAESAPT